MKFTDLKLRENVQKGIDGAGFIDCTSVQEKTFIHTLNGKDVSVQSQTGTGKTAAFLISIFERLLEIDPDHTRKALVIAPTRELAIQIDQEAHLLARALPFKIGCIYGGVGYQSQERLLSHGAEVIIGTPGRLLDLNHQHKLDFGNYSILVIDEADRLFDMGFWPDLRRILDKMPPRPHRQTMLFSATLTQECRRLAADYMNHPVEIEIDPEQVTVDKIAQELYHVGSNEKMRLLLGILRKEKPANALIFANMKHVTRNIAKRLQHNGFQAQYIMGDMPQSKRNRTLEDFKSGQVPILVATDVAARGLHVDDLEMVINYDLPEQAESYIHRIGRTARAGKSGKAIALACERYVYSLEPIEAMIGMKIPVVPMDDSLLASDTSAGLDFRKEGREPQRRGGDRDRGRRSSAPKPHLHQQRRPRPLVLDKKEQSQPKPAAEDLSAQRPPMTQAPGPANGAAPGDQPKKKRRRRRRGPKPDAANAPHVAPLSPTPHPTEEKPGVKPLEQSPSLFKKIVNFFGKTSK